MQFVAFAESIQLFPDGTLFIHIGLILLMIWVLNRTLFKPINQVIAEREKSKGGHSSEAAEMLAQANEKEAAYNRELLEARSRGYEIIETEIKQASALKEQKLNEARSEVAARVSGEKQDLERQAEAAKAAAAAEADRLADVIAATVIKA
ncbi:MAG: hypothetical protein ACK4S4_13030 [Pyrinomonadaceae bacterium]